MKKLVTLITYGLFSANSFAGVVFTSSIVDFNNAGAINIVSDFEEFSSGGFDYPSDPLIQGGVSYNNTDNLIINDNTPYTTNGTNMLVNNIWNPVEGTFLNNYSLFGFDAGWSNQDDNGTTITIGTNLNTYAFNVDFDIASSTSFYGFIADGDEFFTSFNITSNVRNALNAIDNVAVGSISTPVPEPQTYTMFLAGLGLLGFASRYKRLN